VEKPKKKMSMLDRWAEADEHWDEQVEWITPCMTCSHFFTQGKCEAFPDGIPAEIYSGHHKHRGPYAGDRGIQYERKATKG